MKEYHFTVDGFFIAFGISKKMAFEELKVIIDEIYEEGSERWKDVWICKEESK
jgi:hypothetical protein|tara:strand:- start:67 stop:225 length:159 start_codon:yes stop_codon:yes gene_type:complete